MNARTFAVSLIPLLLVLGCSRERARVVEHAETESPLESKDYLAMVERARVRQTAHDHLVTLESARNRFVREVGRTPTNLEELVDRKFLDALPEAPAGETFDYDPAAGSIRVIPAAKVSRP